MINGSLINSTTYNDDFSSLGYIERGFIFFYLLTGDAFIVNCATSSL